MLFLKLENIPCLLSLFISWMLEQVSLGFRILMQENDMELDDFRKEWMSELAKKKDKKMLFPLDEFFK